MKKMVMMVVLAFVVAGCGDYQSETAEQKEQRFNQSIRDDYARAARMGTLEQERGAIQRRESEHRAENYNTMVKRLSGCPE
jgi:hypothetical protein